MIRTAVADDVFALHAFGLTIPELRTSADSDFLSPDEVRHHVGCPDSVFLLAEEEGQIVGFVLASMRDIEGRAHACLIYLAVAADRRGTGVGGTLYDAAEAELRARGVEGVYAWATTSAQSSIQAFLGRRGYKAGGTYVWMDRALS